MRLSPYRVVWLIVVAIFLGIRAVQVGSVSLGEEDLTLFYVSSAAVLLTGLATWYFSRLNLFRYVVSGDTAGLRLALRMGAKPNQRKAAGSNPKARNKDKRWTPLHFAAINDDMEHVELLLQYGADVNSSSLFRATPLWVATRFANWNVAALLLDSGADPNILPQSGISPLMNAARLDSAETIKRLVAAGASLDVRLPVDEDGAGRTALHLAVEAEYPEAISALLQCGASPQVLDCDGLTPLTLAIQNNSPGIVEHLLDQGVDPNAELRSSAEHSPLSLSLGLRRESIAKLLVEKGARVSVQVNKRQAQLLHEASARGDLRTLKFLLQHGADVKAADEAGSTPLHAAMFIGVDRRGQLMSGGLDASQPAPRDEEERSATVIRSLLQAGADIEAGDAEGRTPLHIAAMTANTVAAKLLVKEGANALALNREHETPLHYACSIAALSVIEALIDAGADVNARATFGRQPLDLLAYNTEHLDQGLVEKAAALLTKAGATIAAV